MGSGNNETGKKITRSFDTDAAAVVDTIFTVHAAGLSPRVCH